ncbi:GNAT family N-acetyltransferase [Amycolatopsis anabasis]|uniref:GNAT family N-acetyltransferase n=1 Tax=Amycolatopsis anabasis TaxID=1840409 RepID=UPI00131CF9F0|nr:GNAT family N-acetyltransferase [Amycolatopsis anabasis]
MITEFTEIRTERLVLRPLREADRPTVLEIQTDPRTNEFNPRPPTVEETEQKFAYWLDHWRRYGFGYLVVLEAATGKVLGLGGVQVRQHAGADVLNLYYRFRPAAWGQGYASEMAAAVVDWAERELPERPVLISISVGNKPSIRVAERLGFTCFLEDMYDGALSRHYRKITS